MSKSIIDKLDKKLLGKHVLYKNPVEIIDTDDPNLRLSTTNIPCMVLFIDSDDYAAHCKDWKELRKRSKYLVAPVSVNTNPPVFYATYDELKFVDRFQWVSIVAMFNEELDAASKHAHSIIDTVGRDHPGMMVLGLPSFMHKIPGMKDLLNDIEDHIRGIDPNKKKD